MAANGISTELLLSNRRFTDNLDTYFRKDPEPGKPDERGDLKGVWKEVHDAGWKTQKRVRDAIADGDQFITLKEVDTFLAKPDLTKAERAIGFAMRETVIDATTEKAPMTFQQKVGLVISFAGAASGIGLIPTAFTLGGGAVVASGDKKEE